jgi:hypothetical protein
MSTQTIPLSNLPPGVEIPIVDGFTHSLSTLLLPTTYRSHVLAQMEALRRSTNYQFKLFSAPDSANAAIAAYSQNEYQVKMRPGTLIWGVYVSAFVTSTGIDANLTTSFVQVIDMSTGMGLISDYELTQVMSGNLNPTPSRVYERYPSLLPGPRLVSGSGQVNIEIYNSGGVGNTYQLVLYCAEPMPMPEACADPPVSCPQQ